MAPTSLDHSALGRIGPRMPGLFNGGFARPGAVHDAGAVDWQVPLRVSLPITVAVSLGLWAALFLGLRALL